MSIIEPLFYVPFLKISIENWQGKKKELMGLKEKHKDLFGRHQADHTDTNYHQDPHVLIEPITNILSEELSLFLSAMSLESCSIKEAWYEQASQNDFHVVHSHGPKGYSSACYIEFDKNEHTGTNFICPFANFITGSCMTTAANVDEGDIVFFPSSLLHYTTPNTSSKKRLVLSLNLLI
jgi:ectoine hydroxylase-related dioxygenase (phytanoyl-CoA dioxygenase family)